MTLDFLIPGRLCFKTLVFDIIYIFEQIYVHVAVSYFSIFLDFCSSNSNHRCECLARKSVCLVLRKSPKKYFSKTQSEICGSLICGIFLMKVP